MPVAVVFHPASLVAQREPATPVDLDLEDRSALNQPPGEGVVQARAAAVQLEGGATEIR
jgi:hypothetical protein